MEFLFILAPILISIIIYYHTKSSDLENKISNLEYHYDNNYKDIFDNLKNEYDKSEKRISFLQIKLQELKSLEKYKELKDVEGEVSRLKKTIKALKNIINGYGNEYLIPNHSVLDNLAQEYDYKQAGKDLKETRKLIKYAIKNQQTDSGGYKINSNRPSVSLPILDMYNCKVDAIMSKVKNDNYSKLKQELEDVFYIVNNTGIVFANSKILDTYHQLILKQLDQTVILQELKFQDREEQKENKRIMREEKRVAKEYAAVIKKTEQEEKLLIQTMKQAEIEMLKASVDEKSELEKQLQELQYKYDELKLEKQRALSMAQQTRSGHIYVISNIGSFGENIYKIGMTRRLDPLDRVKELGDASVPFAFDVHTIIKAVDAPNLEKMLHRKFANKKVNKVNLRKEFFNLSLSEIKQEIEHIGIKDVHWTMKADAVEYYESLNLLEKNIQIYKNR
jgi:hypothetical protein